MTVHDLWMYISIWSECGVDMQMFLKKHSMIRKVEKMKYKKVGETGFAVPRVAMGCMHLSEIGEKDARNLIEAAMEWGINFFDHADIYDDGECERRFSQAIRMNDDIREKIILQSKCGIIPLPGSKGPYYDFSKKHILEAVEGSLKRLKTDYLDVLLLHRPDSLMEPEEVAEAFDYLQSKGMVRYFGISNQNPRQIELLRQSLNQKIVFNQMQFSMAHTLMVDTGITVNNKFEQSIDRDGGTIEYCRLHKIAIQAWSPFQKGFFEGVFLGDMEEYAELNKKLSEIKEKYEATDIAIAIAWILKHPAMAQVITGTTKKQRLKDCALGAEIELTKREWYELYLAAGNITP